MSSYSKLIIFVAVLLIISVAVVLIDSSVDSINKTMPDISDSIVNGDNDYNEAVILVNSRSFDESRNKAISAGNNYNDSLDKLNDIKNNFSSDVNDIQDEYIDTVIRELELKLQAVDKLKESIDCFEVNSNYTGTNYASEANDLIYEATKYQDQRDTLVKENPKLFKGNSLF
ncbi:MAG: hypothetical protein IKH29_05470 [Methanobrevibacter sp.]|uniref:hypothetical protein n=1 Tax=Methanobrevibacter sp. TaxID=66852 RepID=UPI0025FADB53|nr:hypothetical protein [Methanobrevibacter sp.]MBR3113146.1 hypothetical protein [Methanobrevibacter sp.]